jgi:uncharacterized phage-associated protein
MASMVQSVHDVAGEIRRRLAGVGELKLHKLLYYAQGHHLATFGEPLFRETISAWDMGPVVGTLWYMDRNNVAPTPEAPLGEAELNTVGYIISRYGGLTGNDLTHLTHTEPPWRNADQRRQAGTSVPIDSEDMRQHFASAARDDDEEGPLLDSEMLKQILNGAEERLARSVQPDSIEDLTERLEKLRG